MTDKADIKIVYDGGCPFCSSYVSLLRLRETVGRVELINARENMTQVRELNQMGLDLDEGMVVFYEDKTYYGSDAVHILALLSSSSSAFNCLNKIIFQNSILAEVAYPIMRLGRNITLNLLGRKKINLKI